MASKRQRKKVNKRKYADTKDVMLREAYKRLVHTLDLLYPSKEK